MNICVNIEDIWGGGQDSNYHRKGIGTALVYFLLQHLDKNYGRNCLVTRTEVYHKAGDSEETIKNRNNFWHKVGISENKASTVSACLECFSVKGLVPNSAEFFLKEIK